MSSAAFSRWASAREKISEKLRGRRGRAELELLLESLERACLEYGREIERESLHFRPAPPRPH